MDIDRAAALCGEISSTIVECIAKGQPQSAAEMTNLTTTAMVMICVELATTICEQTDVDEQKLIEVLQRQIFDGLEWAKSPEGQIMIKAENVVH